MQEEKEGLQRAEQDPTFEEDVRKDWLAYRHPEVYEHFPPQIIIGKQTADDKEFLVYDEDPLVRVSLQEVTCEYNYSNPTGYFNLSIPHIEIRSSNYTTISYQQYKRNIWEMEQKELKRAKEAAAKEAAEQTKAAAAEDVKDPQEDGAQSTSSSTNQTPNEVEDTPIYDPSSV